MTLRRLIPRLLAQTTGAGPFRSRRQLRCCAQPGAWSRDGLRIRAESAGGTVDFGAATEVVRQGIDGGGGGLVKIGRICLTAGVSGIASSAPMGPSTAPQTSSAITISSGDSPSPEPMILGLITLSP